ncbi:MAG: NAD-dependent epimerase/dehydratase family protein [Cyclobacteriaceae bacterium]|nr:NAD-dependent epimerase/dehydratase family protein [Cyclobacteriaceae bacterium]
MQTILGAGGNIGKLLANDLSKGNSTIRLVSRNPQKVNESDHLFPANLLNSEETEKAIAGSEIAYLVAGIPYKAKTWQEQWPVIMRNCLDACTKHKVRLVFFDNMYMYDHSQINKLTEDTPVNPLSKKGKVRAQIAQMLMDDVEKGKLDAMICRAADFYGPNAINSFLNESVIKRMLEGKKPQALINANAKHSFTYTPDASSATAFLASQSDAWNQVWHLPTSSEYPSIQQAVDIIAKFLKTDNKISILPSWSMGIAGLFIPVLKEIPELSYQLEKDYCFDSSKIEKKFGLKATPFEMGLKACLET